MQIDMAFIRLALVRDAAPVQAIYAPLVLNTPVSFELLPPSVDDMAERIMKTGAEYPWLVYESEGGSVLGYAYASRHRERPAYQWGVDVTVYVDSRARRRGIARALYRSLFAILRLQGIFNAYAGIALPNEASVRLHKALGFKLIGVHRRTGYKLAAWHDVAWFELAVQRHQANPAPPVGLLAILEHPLFPAALNEGLRPANGAVE